MTPIPGKGNPSAQIMLVGEAWGEHEERLREPFVGPSGTELNRMLHEAGIMRSECYTTNVVNLRPPANDITKWMPTKKSEVSSLHVDLLGRPVHPYIREGYKILLREIALLKPRVIVAFGNTPLWALAGRTGVMKWRGSLLSHGDAALIPTIHPAAILRQWENRPLVVQDLKRVKRQLTNPVTEPEWNFIIRPSFSQVLETLDDLYDRAESLEDSNTPEVLWLDLDIETRGGHIACIGLGYGRTEAICIPFAISGLSRHYWSSEDEEGRIVFRLPIASSIPRP